MDQKKHWEKVYQENQVNEVGWYTPRLETSLRWIKALNLNRDAGIIDVGGGASTLVDDLAREGYHPVTVVDLSRKALELSRKRLGEKGDAITWIVGDITEVSLPENNYGLWHDRAVFHFLTTPELRQLYKEDLLKALKPGGDLILAVFAPEAPPQCSGLPVGRYTVSELECTFGPEFELKKYLKKLHTTPGGVGQMYLYCHFKKSADRADS